MENVNTIEFTIEDVKINGKVEKLYNMHDSKVLTKDLTPVEADVMKMLEKHISNFKNNEEFCLQVNDLLSRTKHVYNTNKAKTYNSDNLYTVATIANVIKTLAYKNKVFLKLIACKSGRGFNIVLDNNIKSYKEFKAKYDIETKAPKAPKETETKETETKAPKAPKNDEVEDVTKMLTKTTDELKQYKLFIENLNVLMSDKKTSYKTKVENITKALETFTKINN